MGLVFVPEFYYFDSFDTSLPEIMDMKDVAFAKIKQDFPLSLLTNQLTYPDGSIAVKEGLEKLYILPYTQFHTSVMEDVSSKANDQWLAEDYPIQEPRLIVTDVDSSEWIVLTCYDGYKTNAKSDTVKDLFLFSNAGYVKNDELSTFKAWANVQNFYGRWMPECRNGSIDYLWNEYPWSSTYKRTMGDIEVFVKEHNGKQFHLHLSYEAQLQENWIGLDENSVNLREVSMPNHQMMESLDLYTAERGVVRDKKNHSVVARNFAIGKMNGLAIRKEYLDKYLSENQMSLIFYSLGEKYVRGKG